MARNRNKNKSQNDKILPAKDARSEIRVHALTSSTVYSSAVEASPSRSPSLNSSSTPLMQASKRDSVVSSTWEDSKRNHGPQPEPARGRWRRHGICRWWPCRFIRWVRAVIKAIVRASQGPQRMDLVLTFCLAATCIFASYSGVELICRMMQAVAAQDTGLRISRLVVTVSMPMDIPSVPGPSPYYFPIVNSTTQKPAMTQASNSTTVISKTTSRPSHKSAISSTLEASSSISNASVSTSSLVQPQMAAPSVSPSLVPAHHLSINRSSMLHPFPTLICNCSMASSSSEATNGTTLFPSGAISSSGTVTTPQTMPSRSILSDLTFITSHISTTTTVYGPFANSSFVAGPTRLALQKGTFLVVPEASKTLIHDHFMMSPSRTPCSTLPGPSLLSPTEGSVSKMAISTNTSIVSSTTIRSSSDAIVGPSKMSSSLPPRRRLNYHDGVMTLSTAVSNITTRIRPNRKHPSWTLATQLNGSKVTPLVSKDMDQLRERNLVRKVIKVITFGNTGIRFIFPSRDIITTASYWTGIYPTVTGPLPSALQSFSLVTRTQQAPLSAAPSLSLLALASASASSSTTVGGEFASRGNDAEPEGPLCGEWGNFTLTFDDTTISQNRNQAAGVGAANMKTTYHHLFYTNGLVSVADKWEPFPAISQPNIAMFLPVVGRVAKTGLGGRVLPGELGAGPRAPVDAYWFHAYSAYFGCALNGLVACTLRISGYRYDAAQEKEVIVVEQKATVPACLGYINCRLSQVVFNDQFRALSGIRFTAYTSTLGIPQIHMMDDLQLAWYNNSCSAGILRLGHR